MQLAIAVLTRLPDALLKYLGLDVLCDQKERCPAA